MYIDSYIMESAIELLESNNAKIVTNNIEFKREEQSVYNGLKSKGKELQRLFELNTTTTKYDIKLEDALDVFKGLGYIQDKYKDNGTKLNKITLYKKLKTGSIFVNIDKIAGENMLSVTGRKGHHINIDLSFHKK